MRCYSMVRKLVLVPLAQLEAILRRRYGNNNGPGH